MTRKSARKSARLNIPVLAEQVFNETRGKRQLVEDDVSLCDFIRREYGYNLTLKRVEDVRKVMDELEAAEDEKENKVNVIVVLDCRSASPFEPNHVRAYKDTPKGRELAEKVFREWVEDARGDRDEEDDKDESFDLDAVVDEGYYEMGEGFIAKIETNT